MRNTWTLGVSSTVLFFLWEINHFLETLSSFSIFGKVLFLDPWDSRLNPWTFRGSRIERRGSSFGCQLTFEQYCMNSIIISLAPWAGKMNQIACCDWLPEWARWSYLARSKQPAVSRRKKFIYHAKKNLANVEASWPHTWSITHTYNTRATLNINSTHIELDKQSKLNAGVPIIGIGGIQLWVC